MKADGMEMVVDRFVETYATTPTALYRAMRNAIREHQPALAYAYARAYARLRAGHLTERERVNLRNRRNAALRKATS